ncbi:hypothetical protein G9P44_002283 [Scheffersomyces stipitis]|nr:hypothetical protein G9P44_002283 [Scheffersomyces stipitis]
MTSVESNLSLNDTNHTVVDNNGKGAVAGYLKLDLDNFEAGNVDFTEREIISNSTLKKLPKFDNSNYTYVTETISYSNKDIVREPKETLTSYLIRRLKLQWGAKSCVHHSGRVGHLYYHLWAAGGKCFKPDQIKVVAGAMDKAMRLENANFLVSNWCMKLIYRGKWSGIVVIGPTPEVKTLSCEDATIQENYEHDLTTI